jgi:ATP-binding cassette, subfamily F, member 3
LLVESLNKYEGSFILVSHDRYFISKAANKIWEIVDHEIKEFKGTYAEWMEWKERMARLAPKPEKPAPVAPVEKPVTVVEKSSANRAINKEQQKELQKQQRLFSQLEEKIARAAEQKKLLENALGDPKIYSEKQAFTNAELAYKKQEQELAVLNKEYESIFDRILQLEKEIE